MSFFGDDVFDDYGDEPLVPDNLPSDEVLLRPMALPPGPHCPLEFKGGICGYRGNADWCDRGFSRCVALGNHARFCGTP